MYRTTKNQRIRDISSLILHNKRLNTKIFEIALDSKISCYLTDKFILINQPEAWLVGAP